MWLGHDCIWMGREDHFDLFFTPPVLLPVLSSGSFPSATSTAVFGWIFARPFKLAKDRQLFWKNARWINKVRKNDKCIKRVHVGAHLSGLQHQLTPSYHPDLNTEYLDLVQIRESFKPAHCSDGLEEEIKLGLKTMLKWKKSDKNTGKSRNTQEGERKTKRRTCRMRNEPGWKWRAKKTDKCFTRIMWIHCLDAPRKAGWSL